MKTKYLAGIVAVFIGAMMIAGGIVAAPQDEAANTDELALAVANAQKANLATIAKHSWRVKSSISMEGEEKATSITEMMFDSEGKLQATLIGGESKVEKKKEYQKLNLWGRILEVLLQ